jgi:hypothetical protein
MPTTVWRRSSRCGESGTCVEIAHIGTVINMRDAKDPGPQLAFDRTRWKEFVVGIRNGEFTR